MALEQDSQELLNNQRTWQEWQDWWQSPLGQNIWRAQSKHLEPRLQQVRGFRALEFSSQEQTSFLALSSLTQTYVWRPSLETAQASKQQAAQCLISSPYALPLPDASFDLVLIHHALELLAAPEILLQEAARVLQPQGELLVLGFNPSWALALKTRQGNKLSSQIYQPFSLAELNKLSANLGLKRQEQFKFFYARPWHRYLNLGVKLGTGLYMARFKKVTPSPLRPNLKLKTPSWLGAQTVNLPARSGLQKSPENQLEKHAKTNLKITQN